MLRALPAFLLIMAAMTLGAADSIRLVCIGDSITQGRKGGGEHVPTYSWRYPLWQHVVDQGLPVVFVGTMREGFNGTPVYAQHGGQDFPNLHEGRWGWTTRAVADKLVETSQQWTADIAIVLLGTNDKGKEASLEPTLAAMRDIVSVLRGRNAAVKVAIGLPFQEWAPFPALAQAYVKLAADLTSETSPVITVVTGAGWISDPKKPGTHTVDWVHPNPAGDAHLAQCFATALAAWMPGK